MEKKLSLNNFLKIRKKLKKQKKKTSCYKWLF